LNTDFLIIKPSSRGDVVHTPPLVHALKRSNPESTIGWVVQRAFALLDPEKFGLLVAGEKMRGFVDIPPHVRYVGYVENLSALYSIVDYTVLPSRYEPFGLTVVESLHCGTSVLVTRQVGCGTLNSRGRDCS